MFIYLFLERESERERERERERACTHKQKRGRGTGRERIPSRLPTVRQSYMGFKLTDYEIMTSAKIKIQTLNQLSHSGAPK